MKKLYISALAMLAVALGFTACSSDEEIAQTPAKQVTVYASTEEPGQRTALGTQGTDGTYPVLWEAGDKISVGGNVFTLTSGAGNSTGEFTGDAPAAGTYDAYYPSAYNGENWPTGQTYVEGNIPHSVPMKATGITVDGSGTISRILFKNEGGILRLNLKGEATVTVKSITISATNLKHITLNCGAGVPLSGEATPFHIAVPAADYSGLKIAIFDDAGKVCTKTATSAITVQRSKITVINLTNLTASKFTAQNPLKNSTFDVGTTPGQKMVHFTPGNLQYIGSATNYNCEAAPYWRLAETQYSYLGNANYVPTSVESSTRMPANADTEFFGWGEATPPFLCSNVYADYQPLITAANELETDWATKFNNGTPTPLYIEQGVPFQGEQYIVLSSAEWQNLFENQYYCGAIVTLKDGTTKVKGVVVCPSDMDGTAAKNLLGENARKGSKTPTGLYDECALDQSTVDSNGLLFLPAAGYRDGTSVSDVGSGGNYWSTTSYSSAMLAYYVNFDAMYFNSAVGNIRYYGFSVRLASVATSPAE